MNATLLTRFSGEMSPCDHFVQIYDTDITLIDTLADFISSGLEEGHAAVMIATPAHRKALEKRLTAMGSDIAAAQAQDQLISLDAEETMSKFLVNGWPDNERFTELITGILARAGRHGRQVRAFGEMVALMWAKEYYASAIKLEQLWNEVCQKETLSLFCAYPKTGFTKAPTESIADVCALHSKFFVA